MNYNLLYHWYNGEVFEVKSECVGVCTHIMQDPLTCLGLNGNAGWGWGEGCGSYGRTGIALLLLRFDRTANAQQILRVNAHTRDS